MNKENVRPSSSRLGKNSHSIALRSGENSPMHHTGKSNTTRNDCHDQYIKLIIAANADYFQNKLRVAPKGRSKDLRLKIPCHTGMTIYRKDYNQKQARYNKEAAVKHDRSTDCIRTNNFLKEERIDLNINDKTNYQKEFKRHPMPRVESCRRLKKRIETVGDDDKVPRFLQTQNKTDFLNWAGKNYVPSMKPQEKSAVTNLPFEATTVYRSQFEGKSIPPTPLFTRESSFPKFGNISMMLKSNYSSEFSIKRGHGVETSCKPKHAEATLCKQFKGTTEYKRQFHGGEVQRNEDEGKYRTIEDLQTLIIDL